MYMCVSLEKSLHLGCALTTSSSLLFFCDEPGTLFSVLSHKTKAFITFISFEINRSGFSV